MNEQNSEMVYYFKSIVNGIPNYYSKFKTYSANSFIQDSNVSFDLGPDPNYPSNNMVKFVRANVVKTDDNWNTINNNVSANPYYGGDIYKAVPKGTGCDAPNGWYFGIDFSYSFSMSFDYIGTMPPSALTGENVNQIYSLMEMSGFPNIVE